MMIFVPCMFCDERGQCLHALVQLSAAKPHAHVFVVSQLKPFWVGRRRRMGSTRAPLAFADRMLTGAGGGALDYLEIDLLPDVFLGHLFSHDPVPPLVRRIFFP